jgi:hypothetical protein
LSKDKASLDWDQKRVPSTTIPAKKAINKRKRRTEEERMFDLRNELRYPLLVSFHALSSLL